MNGFVTALIGPPFGVEGFARIKSFSGEIEHLLQRKTITGRLHNRETLYEIDGFICQGSSNYIKFKGIDTPEAVRKLVGTELIVERKEAALLKSGEYYIEDLKGLALINLEGKKLAVIVDLVEGGGGFLIEASLAGGEKKYIPFRKEFIGEISLEKNSAELLAPWILA